MLHVRSPALLRREEAVQLHFGPKFPLRTPNHRIRIGSSVIDHAIMNAKPPCQQSRAARQTGRVRRMNVIEHHRRLRELIDIGRGISVISVATQVVRPQSINVYIQDSQRAPTDLLVRPTTIANEKSQLSEIKARRTLRV